MRRVSPTHTRAPLAGAGALFTHQISADLYTTWQTRRGDPKLRGAASDKNNIPRLFKAFRELPIKDSAGYGYIYKDCLYSPFRLYIAQYMFRCYDGRKRRVYES